MSASDDRSMAVRAGFAEVVRSAADRVEEASLADATRGAAKAHGTLRDADIALRLSSAGEPPSDALSTPTRRTIERGRKRLAIDYNRALEHRNAIDAALAPAFHVAHALIWASANGEAPHDGAGGNVPAITTVVSLLGLPAVTVPMLRGDRGLPIGVTLVGPRGDDARLLQSALWLVQRAKG